MPRNEGFSIYLIAVSNETRKMDWNKQWIFDWSVPLAPREILLSLELVCNDRLEI